MIVLIKINHFALLFEMQTHCSPACSTVHHQDAAEFFESHTFQTLTEKSLTY